MIPTIMFLRIRSEDFRLRLWIPLFLIWIVALPLALILIPLIVIASGILRASGKPIPVLGIGVLLVELITRLRGTQIHVNSPKEGTLVDISIW